MVASLLLSLSLLYAASVQSEAVDISQQKNILWGERGLSNPSRRIRDIADSALLYFNATTEIRPVLIFTIATPASLNSTLPRLLANLASFKSSDQVDTYGHVTTLAQHTIVASTSMPVQLGCDSLQRQYQHKCFEFDHSINSGVEDMFALSKAKAHAYSVGLSRIKALVDLISLGYDVFYFDLHHIFLQNPLKYMYTLTSAPVVVSGTPSSGCRPLMTGADGRLPDDHHRLDILFIRSQPSSFRCLYNWLYWSTHTQHDVNDKPLDHHTFRNTMQECVNSLGTSVINVQYLDPHAFPSDCATKCGCNNNAAVEPGPDGSCPKEVVSKWVGYLLGCSGSNAVLNTNMVKYQTMWAAWNATQGH